MFPTRASGAFQVNFNEIHDLSARPVRRWATVFWWWNKDKRKRCLESLESKGERRIEKNWIALEMQRGEVTDKGLGRERIYRSKIKWRVLVILRLRVMRLGRICEELHCVILFWTRYRFMIGCQYKIMGKRPPTPPQPKWEVSVNVRLREG